MANEFLLSTAFLPPIEYMAILASNDQVKMEACEHYTKQSWRNRCRILTANGPLDLSIPVIKSNGNHTPIHAMKLSEQENWAQKHWRALVSAYNASPYLLYYQDELEACIKDTQNSLFDYNFRILSLLCELLEIDCEIHKTKSFLNGIDANQLDLRNGIHPKSLNLIDEFPVYNQVFEDRLGFVSNGISVVDLLFNEGPNAGEYLRDLGERISKL